MRLYLIGWLYALDFGEAKPHCWQLYPATTPFPKGELEYPCYADCPRGYINAGNDPWSEVEAFVSSNQASETWLTSRQRNARGQCE